MVDSETPNLEDGRSNRSRRATSDHLAKVIEERKRRRSAPWSVYQIRAPGLVYVGISRNPARRWRTHQARIRAVRAGRVDKKYAPFAGHSDAEISFEVVAEKLWPPAVYRVETRLIKQFRTDKSVRCLNVVTDMLAHCARINQERAVAGVRQNGTE